MPLKLYIIPLRRLSTIRRKELVNNFSPDSLAMRPCASCRANSLSCRLGNKSEKCLEYVRRSLPCDLVISPSVIRRVYRDHLKLLREVREARARLIRLKR